MGTLPGEGLSGGTVAVKPALTASRGGTDRSSMQGGKVTDHVTSVRESVTSVPLSPCQEVT